MEKRHRNLLRKNRIKLVKDMEPGELLNYLFQEGVFTDNDLDSVKSQMTRQAQAEKILDTLPRRGPKAFDVFCDALSASDAQRHLVIDLQANISQESQPPESSRTSGQDTGTTKGPSEYDSRSSTYSGAAVTGTPSVNTSKPNTPSINTTAKDNDNDVYKMDSKPHGWCIIINNVKFDQDSGLKDRTGSNVDANNLQSLFLSLQYQVKKVDNLTSKKMKETLFAFAKDDHKRFDSVVVCILSHGVKGRIYGTDGGLVATSDIISMFNGYQAKDLIGKPKLFFLQACRGGDFDRGAKLEQVDGAHSAPVNTEVSNEQILDDFYPNEDVDSGFLDQQSLPSEADFLIAYATVPGYVSWRNQEKGSWFIQALVEVFSKDASSEDLLSMLVKVNRKVALEFESFNRKKQMPAPVIMLTKKLYFSPQT